MERDHQPLLTSCAALTQVPKPSYPQFLHLEYGYLLCHDVRIKSSNTWHSPYVVPSVRSAATTRVQEATHLKAPYRLPVPKSPSTHSLLLRPKVQRQDLGGREKSPRAPLAFPSGRRHAAPRPHGSLQPAASARESAWGAGRVGAPRGLPDRSSAAWSPRVGPKDPTPPCAACATAPRAAGQHARGRPGGGSGPAAPVLNE